MVTLYGSRALPPGPVINRNEDAALRNRVGVSRRLALSRYWGQSEIGVYIRWEAAFGRLEFPHISCTGHYHVMREVLSGQSSDRWALALRRPEGAFQSPAC